MTFLRRLITKLVFWVSLFLSNALVNFLERKTGIEIEVQSNWDSLFLDLDSVFLYHLDGMTESNTADLDRFTNKSPQRRGLTGKFGLL